MENAESKIDQEFEDKQKLLMDESNAFVDHKKKVMRSPRATDANDQKMATNNSQKVVGFGDLQQNVPDKRATQFVDSTKLQELQDEKKKQLVVFGDDEDSDEGNKEDSDNDFTKEDRIAMRQKLSGVNDTGDSYLME